MISVVIAEFGNLVKVPFPKIQTRSGVLSWNLSKSERDKEFLRSLKRSISERIGVKEKYIFLLTRSGEIPTERNIQDNPHLFLFFSQTKSRNDVSDYMISYERFADLPGLEENPEDSKKRKNSKTEFFKTMFERQNEAIEAIKLHKERNRSVCLELVEYVKRFDSEMEKYRTLFSKKLKSQLEEYISEFDPKNKLSPHTFITKELAEKYLRVIEEETLTVEDLISNFKKKVPVPSLLSKHKRIELIFPVRGPILTSYLSSESKEDDAEVIPSLYEMNRLSLKTNIKLYEEYQIVVDKCLRFKDGYDLVISTQFEKFEFLSFMLSSAKSFLLMMNNNNNNKSSKQKEEETEGEEEEEIMYDNVKGRVYDHMKYALVVDQIERRKSSVRRIRSTISEEGKLQKKLEEHLHKNFKARQSFFKIFFSDLYKKNENWRNLETQYNQLLFFSIPEDNILFSQQQSQEEELDDFKDHLHPMFFREKNENDDSGRNKLVECILKPLIFTKKDESSSDGDSSSTLSIPSSLFSSFTRSVYSEQQQQQRQQQKSKPEEEEELLLISEEKIEKLKEDLDRLKEEKQEESKIKEELYKSVLRDKFLLEGKVENLEREKTDLSSHLQSLEHKLKDRITEYEKKIESLQSQILSLQQQQQQHYEKKKKKKNVNNNNNEEEEDGKWTEMITPLVLQVNSLKRERAGYRKKEKIMISKQEELESKTHEHQSLIHTLKTREGKIIIELERMRVKLTELEMKNHSLMKEKKILKEEQEDKRRQNQRLIEQMKRSDEEKRRKVEDVFTDIKKKLQTENQSLILENTRLKEKNSGVVVDTTLKLQGEKIQELHKTVEELEKKLKEVSISRDHITSKFILLKETNSISSSSSSSNNNNNNINNNNNYNNNNNNYFSPPPKRYSNLNLHHPSSRPPPNRFSQNSSIGDNSPNVFRGGNNNNNNNEQVRGPGGGQNLRNPNSFVINQRIVDENSTLKQQIENLENKVLEKERMLKENEVKIERKNTRLDEQVKRIQELQNYNNTLRHKIQGYSSSTSNRETLY